MGSHIRSYGGGFSSGLRRSFTTLKPSWLLVERGSACVVIGFCSRVNPKDEAVASIDTTSGEFLRKLIRADAQAELEKYLPQVIAEVRGYEEKYK